MLAYGSVAAEYEALQTRAAVFDRSHRGRLRVKGPRAAEMVTGLVTNDVAALAPGQGCYAAALTAKGKIVADVRVFVEEDGILVDAPPRAAAAWAAMVKKFVNPRIAPHSDESARCATSASSAPTARHVVSELTGVQAPALTALAPYAHVSVQLDGATLLVAKVPDIEVEGFELFVPVDSFDGAVDARGRRRRSAGRPRGVGHRARRGGAPRMGDRHRRQHDPAGSKLRRAPRDLLHEGVLRRAGDGGARPLPRPREQASARRARVGDCDPPHTGATLHRRVGQPRG